MEIKELAHPLNHNLYHNALYFCRVLLFKYKMHHWTSYDDKVEIKEETLREIE